MRELPKNDYNLMVAMSLIYANYIWCFIGGAFWFMEPILKCKTIGMESEFSCSTF